MLRTALLAAGLGGPALVAGVHEPGSTDTPAPMVYGGADGGVTDSYGPPTNDQVALLSNKTVDGHVEQQYKT